MSELNEYKYRGSRASILLHEKYLRKFLATWKTAAKSDIRLPQTDDPNYDSLITLLRHVLWWARDYMVWMCAQLKLPDPDIKPVPDIDDVEAEAEQYIEHVLEKWRTPLTNVPEEMFHSAVYKTQWNIRYCIDAYLEHTVMHPIKHRFQLLELMEK
ncbi:hypothetical protein ACFL6I_01725 [candidate division KSB1 bacterium]